ncbi:MAG: 50S ribosomal protein L21 [bacterium]
MQAIVEIGGRQHIVSTGETLKVDRLDAGEGETVAINSVLALLDGGDSLFGTPHVAGASVHAQVLSHGKNPKIVVFKYKPKKRVRVTRGHRQDFSLIRVEKITAPDNAEKKVKSAPADAEKKADPDDGKPPAPQKEVNANGS